ncbi:hypothetical protein BaRGS_00003673 [Batillaria attramentaria]|uniref:Uncharacterized protein n=1 Tax=Batillaria attramentaria TaxID=370345 RepID=A0ABD0M065_9CAEN
MASRNSVQEQYVEMASRNSVQEQYVMASRNTVQKQGAEDEETVFAQRGRVDYFVWAETAGRGDNRLKGEMCA